MMIAITKGMSMNEYQTLDIANRGVHVTISNPPVNVMTTARIGLGCGDRGARIR